MVSIEANENFKKWCIKNLMKCRPRLLGRDEKDRPFCGPTRTGFGADFELVQTSDLGFGPDLVRWWSVRVGPVGPDRKIGPKVRNSYP